MTAAVAAAAAVTSAAVAGHPHASGFTGHLESAASSQVTPAPAPGSKVSGRTKAPVPAPSRGTHPAAGHSSRASAAVPPAAPSPAAPPEQPLQFYDTVMPAAVPAGKLIATYSTGRYAVPASAVAGRPTIWIDAWGTDPGASVLDVEPGDATPARAAIWVAQKLAKDPTARARLYTMRAEWPAVQAAISTLPSWMQAHVRYWIADPTGVPHMVPGASATQWYWGKSYDISTANPGF